MAKTRKAVSSLFVDRSKDEKRNFQVKLEKDILDRADKINEGLKRINPDLEFNKTRIVEEALRDAVEHAEKELKRMKELDAETV